MAKVCCMPNTEVSMEDIIITDDAVIKPIDVIFKNLKHESSAVTMVVMLHECPVYARVTVVGKLFSISQTALNVEKSQPYK